jgi:small subunit ribosomal protein S21
VSKGGPSTRVSRAGENAREPSLAQDDIKERVKFKTDIHLCGWCKIGRCCLAGLGVVRLAEVRLQEGESIENALRRFKRKVQTEDIIKEVKRHSYYLKPGEKLRLKQALARKRARKKIRKEKDA